MAEMSPEEQAAFEEALAKKNEYEAAQAAMGTTPPVVEGEEGELGVTPTATTPVQTTYPSGMRPGVEGAIANEEPVRLISRNVEDAAGIPFGRGVIQGVADKGCKLGAYTTEGMMLGVTVRERSIGPDLPNGFAQYSSARIMRSGCIWVAVTNAVVAGDPAKIDATGKWGKGSGTGDVPHARFDTSQPTVGGLAILRVDG
jgi:hypothetical protein